MQPAVGIHGDAVPAVLAHVNLRVHQRACQTQRDAKGSKSER